MNKNSFIYHLNWDTGLPGKMLDLLEFFRSKVFPLIF